MTCGVLRKIKPVDSYGEVITGIYDIYGKIYDELGFNRIIKGSSDDRKYNEVLKALVLMRLAHPENSTESVHQPPRSCLRIPAKTTKDNFLLRIDWHRVFGFTS